MATADLLDAAPPAASTSGPSRIRADRKRRFESFRPCGAADRRVNLLLQNFRGRVDRADHGFRAFLDVDGLARNLRRELTLLITFQMVVIRGQGHVDFDDPVLEALEFG